MKKKKINPNTASVDYIYDKEEFEDIGVEQNFKFEMGFNRISNIVNKRENTKRRIIKGHASTNDKDRADDIITMDALIKAKGDLLKQGSRTIFFNHDRSKPIGKVISTHVDDIGLLVKIVLSKEENEIWNKVKEGIINKFSIKGRAADSEEVIGLNNKKILQLNNLELFEVSLVSVPANVEAKTISWYIMKSLKNMTKKKKKEEIKAKKTKSEEDVEDENEKSEEAEE